MIGLNTAFARDLLSDAVGGRGVGSVSIVAQTGAAPETYWLPESPEEPAFLAYSITKTFSAALILKLAEERQLDLDDSVAKWFPRIPQASRISIRQLLNHTAGIADYGPIAGYHRDLRRSPKTPWSFDRFLLETIEQGLLFEPGSGWAYSNAGYMLIKAILERVSGITFRSLVAERIAAPLRLDRTFVPEAIEDLASLAHGESTSLSLDGAPRDVRAYYHPGWVSHGVIASTATDVVRFFDALFGRRFLSRRSLDEMTTLVFLPKDVEKDEPTGHSPLRPGKPGYGLGLMGDPASPWGLLLGHNGGGPGYSASAFTAPDLDGITVCAMGAIEGQFDAAKVVADILVARSDNQAKATTPTAKAVRSRLNSG